MKRLIPLLLLLIMVISVRAFVTVDGTRLMLNGKPYRFIGTNFWYGPILASKGQGGDRTRLMRELDSLQVMGINNLRVLVGSDGSRGAKTKVEPTLQTSPGVYNDTILDGLDFFMAELGKRGMQAVLYLNNSWEWSGGYGYYLEEESRIKVASGTKGCMRVRRRIAPLHALASNEVSWDEYCQFYSHFATNKKAHELFYNYAKFILSRTNRYTGKPYAKDPAIFSWQIGNEPRAFSKDVKREFAQWIKEAAALIRSLDRNHLISIGSEGIVGCEGDEALYEELCADKNIDVLNLHLWPSNWGWAKKTIEAGDLERSILKSTEYINKHVCIARKLNKPLVLEEFGFPRDGGSYSLYSSVEARNEYYAFIFSQLLKAVNERSPLVGVNFWGWSGCARPQHESWQVGDDYTCDPAHEPQGLYSVFDSDTFTVNLIKDYTQRLCHTSSYALPWRGVMIDVSRHFLPIEYLYKEVDAMAHFGLNRLHLHLTDNAGWRIEIKSRPKLTDIGAWRSAASWEDWRNEGQSYSDSINGFGGFYRQEELRKLVAYAAQRGIEIVPEIEFPSHSAEVIAAYPEVGNEKSEFDMLKPETYRLMRDVLEEVARIFPSEYLHVGGDEAATQHDIQPEGMRRIKQIIDSLGRKMVVWDEALTDNPADSGMVIMVWRNISTAQRAAELGHEVILSPGKYCYFDKAQDCPATEPRAAGGYLPIDSVYGLPNPFSEKHSAKLIGVQGNMWTERIGTPEYAEYMLWPRAFAIAELGREGLKEPRDYKAFHQRATEATDYLQNHLDINAFDLKNEGGERNITFPYLHDAMTQKDVNNSREKSSSEPQTPSPYIITYNTPAHKAYTGSDDGCLIDGKGGGWNFGDGTWQGFIGKNGMDVTIDLGKVCKLQSIEGDFLQCCGPDIFFPYTIIITTSKDGKNFKPLHNLTYPQIYAAQPEDYKQLGWKGKTTARYIRFEALPGEKRGWIFCSEIIIN